MTIKIIICILDINLNPALNNYYYMQRDNQLLMQFNDGLLEMRELFHSTGRLEDSNTKLDEIVKLLCLEIASVRDPQSKLPSLNEILHENSNNNTLVKALNEALLLASRSSVLINYDGSSLLGPNPKFNIAESEEPLARALAHIVLNSFNGYLRATQTAKSFEFMNEAFCHFIRDNFRQNIEDAQYMTPVEAVNFMVDIGINYLKCKKFTKSNPPIVCDPSCGVGSFLTQFYRQWVLEEKQNIKPILLGQDKVDRMARLSFLNLAFFGKTDSQIYRGNSLLAGSPLDSYTEKCDLIITNPPFGAKFSSQYLSKHSQHFFPFLHKYIHNHGGDIDSELLFLDRYISLLKPGGLLLVVLPDSVISSFGLPSYLREEFQLHLTIKSITELPAVTFAQAGTRTKTCILEIEKNQHKNNIIFMSKALSLGYEVSTKKGVPYKRKEGKNDLLNLVDIVCDSGKKREEFTNLEVISSDPSCVAVNQNTIIENTWTPSHYSSERLSTLEKIENLANTEDYEILPLSSLVTLPNRKRQAFSVYKEQKCISVLH
ncbi:MAG: class I SAM-dependent DNA methyltransferase, partial [Dolichospermum sp.]